MTVRVEFPVGAVCGAAFASICCMTTTPAKAEETAILDLSRSSFDFVALKRLGPPIQGEFRNATGRLDTRLDGQRQVMVVLQTNSVNVEGSAMQTRVAKSDLLFASQRYPQIEFRSDWHSPQVLRTGGVVGGTVTLRGVTLREQFTVLPSTCAQPGERCAIETQGRINRERYGMKGLGAILRPEVELQFKVRFLPTGSASTSATASNASIKSSRAGN